MADEPLIPTDPARRKSALAGIFFLALGLGFCYFFMYRPLHALTTTGHMEYYLKGVIIGPLCLYMGLLAATGKYRDGEIRKLNDKGKPTFTRKGWIVMGGALLVMGLTIGGWYWYLNSIGSVASGTGS